MHWKLRFLAIYLSPVELRTSQSLLFSRNVVWPGWSDTLGPQFLIISFPGCCNYLLLVITFELISCRFLIFSNYPASSYFLDLGNRKLERLWLKIYRSHLDSACKWQLFGCPVFVGSAQQVCLFLWTVDVDVFCGQLFTIKYEALKYWVMSQFEVFFSPFLAILVARVVTLDHSEPEPGEWNLANAHIIATLQST